MQRGEIWWAELPPPLGSEPGYRRPVVIIQSNDFNKSRISTVIVVILTSNLHLEAAPGNVLLTKQSTGLSRDSVANVSQVITIDKSFLATPISTLSPSEMGQVEDGLRLVLDL